jgi:hypothetical protein
MNKRAIIDVGIKIAVVDLVADCRNAGLNRSDANSVEMTEGIRDCTSTRTLSGQRRSNNMTNAIGRSHRRHRMMWSFAHINSRLYDEIMFEFEFPDEIAEQTALLMTQLGLDDVLAVHKCVEDRIAARRFEIELRDGDMDEVIEKFDAMLPAMLQWLKRNGIIHVINPGPPS